jgi:hypothetical protein
MGNRLLYRSSPETSPDGLRRSACFSSCRLYRYSLSRVWGEGDRVLFIGLNPSTADHEIDDPTVRRCLGFARRWGYSQFDLVNLFAFRSTDPLSLRTAADPIGPLNDQVVQRFVAKADLVIAAWGNGGHGFDRVDDIWSLLPDVYCLGITKTGSPRHPLYVPGETEPIPYRREKGDL